MFMLSTLMIALEIYRFLNVRKKMKNIQKLNKSNILLNLKNNTKKHVEKRTANNKHKGTKSNSKQMIG